MSVKTQAVDGRAQRGLRNRAAIVDAMMAMYADGVLRPTAREVAERAGVSLRAVFAHFDDVESLREAVAEEQIQRSADLLDRVDPDLPLSQRVDRVVEQRRRLHEFVTPVRRAALLSVHESPAIAARLRWVNRRLRTDLVTLFEPELAVAPEETLDVLDLLLSWDTWNRLRTTQRLGAARAAELLRGQVRRLLG